MEFDEYKDRLMEIRVKVNTLLDDIGATYSTQPEMLEKILNIAMNGDFDDVKDGKVKTSKIISVIDFHKHEYWENTRDYI